MFNTMSYNDSYYTSPPPSQLTNKTKYLGTGDHNYHNILIYIIQDNRVG